MLPIYFRTGLQRIDQGSGAVSVRVRVRQSRRQSQLCDRESAADDCHYRVKVII